MVDVRKRTLQWKENLERTEAATGKRTAIPAVEVKSLSCHYEISAELAARLNAEIADYNRNRNALSLWSVLAICIENEIPVPDQVSEFFLNVSRKLVG